MVAKKTKKTAKKVKNLPAKAVKNVKGGAFNGFVNFGDIKGESTDKDHKDWVMMSGPPSFSPTRKR